MGSVSDVKSVHTYETDDKVYRETTYYSEEEKAERRERAAQSGGPMAGSAMASGSQGFDLWIYSRNLGGDATGWRAAMTVLSVLNSPSARLDLGLVFGSVSTATSRDGIFLLTHASTGGVLVRYNRAFGPVLAYAESTLNFYGFGFLHEPRADVPAQGNTLAHDVRNLPLRVGASAALFHRLYVDVALTTPRPFSGVVGLSTSVGARF